MSYEFIVDVNKKNIDKLKDELQSILNLDDCVGYEDIINKLLEEISFLEKENKRLYKTIDNKMTHIQRLNKIIKDQ